MLRIHGNKLSQSKFSRMLWLRLAGIISCCALTLMFGLMLFPSLPQYAKAADFNPPSGTPVTDSSTGTSVGISLPASIDFASVAPTPDGAITTATADLTVTTTNSASYSLYLYSSDGDNSLRPKISSLANISTINATAGDVGLTLSSLKPNTWGYNLGTTTPDDNTTYSAVPTDNSAPIQTKDTTTTNSANDTYTLSFGAKVDSTIASGAYSNALTVAVVAEPGDIVINYDANGGYFNGDASQITNSVSYDVKELSTQTINEPSVTSYYNETFTIPNATSLTVSFSCSAGRMGSVFLYDGSGKTVAYCSGTPVVTPDGSIDNSSISGIYAISGDTVSISVAEDNVGPSSSVQATITGYSITATSGTQELTPTRPGYNFAGWYTDTAGTSGNEFVPNGNMTPGTTVYAKWEEAPIMQGFTNSQCQSLASDSPYIVKDSRDGNIYTVRYINGACWMTQNLRLAGGTTLNSSTSNVVTDYIIPSTPLAGSSSSNFEGQIQDSGDASKGYWYNFCAASAGTSCSNSSSSNTIYDICPKDWRLPTNDEQNGIASHMADFSPVTGGWYGSGTLYGTANGYWWSSTALNDSYQYYLRYYNNNLNTGTDRRHRGYYVRCIRSS